METRHTPGPWYIERTSPEDGDFQARILSNAGKRMHAGEMKDQIYIIVGEPSKRNGVANIHWEPDALLIAAAPEMLDMLKDISDTLEAGDTPHVYQINELIKKATEQ